MLKSRLLGLAVGLGLAAGFGFAPSPSTAAVIPINCGEHNGNLCDKDCLDECSTGECCHWTYKYFPNNIP